MKRRIASTVAAVAMLFAHSLALHSQQVSKIQSRHKATQPEIFVGNFYRLVVARHPVSIPDKAEMKVFAPYLSRALLNKIDVTLACSDDWDRQHPAPPILKPPFDWLESGLFSGGNEKASPRLYHVEGTLPQTDGSFRVYVRLTWGLPEHPWIWHVIAVVLREDGHFAIDDVIYLKDEPEESDWRLSDVLAEGCDGPRWVGDSNKR